MLVTLCGCVRACVRSRLTSVRCAVLYVPRLFPDRVHAAQGQAGRGVRPPRGLLRCAPTVTRARAYLGVQVGPQRTQTVRAVPVSPGRRIVAAIASAPAAAVGADVHRATPPTREHVRWVDDQAGGQDRLAVVRGALVPNAVRQVARKQAPLVATAMRARDLSHASGQQCNTGAVGQGPAYL
jgi:hypothetical protein